MNVYEKLMTARLEVQGMDLKKSGENTFAKYKYFELGDFLPATLDIFNRLKLCGVVSYTAAEAKLAIVDMEKPEHAINITSPMGSASLKGCHEVQNIGAVETYQRRYLWGTAMEIVEHDALDSGAGSEPRSPQPSAGIRQGARDGIGEDLPEDWRNYLKDLAADVSSLVRSGRIAAAQERIDADNLEPDQRIYLESQMDSKTRSALKKA